MMFDNTHWWWTLTCISIFVHGSNIGPGFDQQLGGGGAWKPDDGVRVELVHWSLRVDREMQQGAALSKKNVIC